VDIETARSIAQYSHAGQRSRSHERIIEHVERVAAQVPATARPIAYLHDVLEKTSTSVSELRAQGLTDLELSAVELLTHRASEAYDVYILRIAFARGAAGALARIVKLADLNDNLAHPWELHAPPYNWARRRIATSSQTTRPSV
jgi:(p)ppGpp synthase/HD superfamily hydrolase